MVAAIGRRFCILDVSMEPGIGQGKILEGLGNLRIKLRSCLRADMMQTVRFLLVHGKGLVCLCIHLIQVFLSVGDDIDLLLQLLTLFQDFCNAVAVLSLELLDREKTFLHGIDLIFGKIHLIQFLP